jgi:NitT/TauT family transport system ATP-binding protein
MNSEEPNPKDENVTICVEQLRKTFPSQSAERLVVLDDLWLTVRRAEFVTIFGPNGCGKSTLLHILAGVQPWDSGTVTIDGAPPGGLNVGFVFQAVLSSLLPWRRVEDNIAWPLELRHVGRATRRQEVVRFLDRMEISLPLERYPYQLSGGQQQLVAIARALIGEPRALFLDEPFNQLDYQTRLRMQIQMRDMWRRTSTTVLFVSHDVDEALFLGDRLVVLSQRPTHVLGVMENRLPHPRSHDLLRSPEFFALRAKALEMFSGALAA